MADKRPIFTEKFSINLTAIETFLGKDGNAAFQRLLERLFDEVIPMESLQIKRSASLIRSAINKRRTRLAMEISKTSSSLGLEFNKLGKRLCSHLEQQVKLYDSVGWTPSFVHVAGLNDYENHSTVSFIG